MTIIANIINSGTMAMLSLSDKNCVRSASCDDNSSFAMRSDIKTIVPIIAREAVIDIAAVVVVVVATTVVVVVVTVVIISSPSFCDF